MGTDADNRLTEIFLEPVRKCYEYRPAFGLSRSDGVSYEDFNEIFGADPFYSLIGLASPSVYAAHKAAGGLTSVYRQLGIGAERLFRAILGQQLDLRDDQLMWAYDYAVTSSKSKTHTLDACLKCDDLSQERREMLSRWIAGAISSTGRAVKTDLQGVVFEVRQGYKSADSKRQNADLRFGLNAYQSNMLPAFAIFSNQVIYPVISRYRADGMLVLMGLPEGSSYESTFTFLEEVAGFDLIAFFKRNQETIRTEVKGVVSSLLKA